MPSRDAAVLEYIDRLIASEAQGAAQAALLRVAVTGLHRHVAEARAGGTVLPWFDFPFAIAAAAIAAAAAPAEAASVTPLAAACSLVFLGLDILDDVADGDRPRHWGDTPPAIMNLAAATVLTTLPPLILMRLDIAPERRAAMQQTLALGLLRMSAGQQTDLALTGADEAESERIEQSVIGKAGEQYATYCALAAQLIAAPPPGVENYAEMGRCFGTACQLLSDCNELLCDPEMRDLAHGARTLPVALYLRRLTGDERQRFLTLLGIARHDIAARREARQRVLDSGVVRRVLVKAEIYRNRARRAALRATGQASLVPELDTVLQGLAPPDASL
jgi:geranylgeranyl pyrophosphate synthase